MDNGDATNGDVVIAKEIAECAVTCKLEPSDTVRAYVEAGIAPATRRAYKADLEHFRAWGGDIPTTDIQLAAYLAEQATTLKVATLTRRLAAISIAHKAQRLPSPVSSPLVRATMRGVRREHGTAQRQADTFFKRLAAVRCAFRCVASIMTRSGLRPLMRQRCENLVEHPHTAPANEPIVDRLVRAILRRGVAPTKPILDHKHNRAHDPTVVHSRDAMRQRKIPPNPTHLSPRQQEPAQTQMLGLLCRVNVRLRVRGGWRLRCVSPQAGGRRLSS